MTLLDISLPTASQTVFDRTVASDWYDGLTSGITKSSRLGAAFRFDLIAWGQSQEIRVFALSPLEIAAFDRIVELLPGQQEAKWPIWFPEWPICRSEESAQALQIRELLSQIGQPKYAIACDSVFKILLAAQEFDSSSRKHLPQTFNVSPASNDFRYWSDLLVLSEP